MTKLIKPKVVRIERSRWRCGGDGFEIDRDTVSRNLGETTLYSPSTKLQCCLGFYARAAGCSISDIKDEDTPNDIEDKVVPGLVRQLENEKVNTKFCETAMWINDNEEFTQKERESKLRKLFAKNKVKLVIVGKYTKKQREVLNMTKRQMQQRVKATFI